LGFIEKITFCYFIGTLSYVLTVTSSSVDGYGCTFGAGIGGSFKDCHCSGSSSGSGCSFDGVPSEDQKTNFQLLEFKVQQKLYAANSKMFYLNLREAVVEAEALANESNRTVIEQKTIQVNEGETILKQCIEDFEKRKAEEKKLDDLLLMVKGNNEVLLMLKKMLSSRKLTASVEAGNQKVDGADPPEKGESQLSSKLALIFNPPASLLYVSSCM
jgi:hypothetical protein